MFSFLQSRVLLLSGGSDAQSFDQPKYSLGAQTHKLSFLWFSISNAPVKVQNNTYQTPTQFPSPLLLFLLISLRKLCLLVQENLWSIQGGRSGKYFNLSAWLKGTAAEFHLLPSSFSQRILCFLCCFTVYGYSRRRHPSARIR